MVNLKPIIHLHNLFYRYFNFKSLIFTHTLTSNDISYLIVIQKICSVILIIYKI